MTRTYSPATVPVLKAAAASLTSSGASMNWITALSCFGSPFWNHHKVKWTYQIALIVTVTLPNELFPAWSKKKAPETQRLASSGSRHCWRSLLCKRFCSKKHSQSDGSNFLQQRAQNKLEDPRRKWSQSWVWKTWLSMKQKKATSRNG